jgi:FeS assembly SUF system protein
MSTSRSIPTNPDDRTPLEHGIVSILRTVYDPEIPVDIYELGLIYGVTVFPEGAVHIRMTLTSPACPVAGTLPPEVEEKVRSVPGVTDARVEIVWDPPWNPSMMTEAAKLQLGFL